jgi:hypothetical protein
MSGDEGGDLGQGHADDAADAEIQRPAVDAADGARPAHGRRARNAGSRRQSTSASTMARSSTISQPTAILPRSVSTSRVLQRFQQHDGAGDRQRQAEDEAPPRRPAQQLAQAPAEQRREADLDDGAGHGDAAHRQQVLQRKMQADAEHQQDDADLGQLRRQALVGDEAGRVTARPGRRPRDSRPAAADCSRLRWLARRLMHERHAMRASARMESGSTDEHSR